jgi:hypothetical protein
MLLEDHRVRGPVPPLSQFAGSLNDWLSAEVRRIKSRAVLMSSKAEVCRIKPLSTSALHKRKATSSASSGIDSNKLSDQASNAHAGTSST